MSTTDWDTVTVLRKKAPKASQMKTESAINQARRQGLEVETKEKCKTPFKLSSLSGLNLGWGLAYL